MEYAITRITAARSMQGGEIMLIRRNVEPKAMMASLLAVSRTWRKKAGAARPWVAGHTAKRADDGCAHRPHHSAGASHV